MKKEDIGKKIILASIILGLSLIICVGINAYSNRYELIKNTVWAFDKWTGTTKKIQ